MPALGAASERRRFLDRLVSGFDRDHAARIGRYERAMRERNRLLKGAGPRGDGSWLDAIETAMAEAGVAVAAARRSLVGRLGAHCREPAGAFPAAAIAVEGAVEGDAGGHAGARRRGRGARAPRRPAGGWTARRGARPSASTAAISPAPMSPGTARRRCARPGSRRRLLVRIVLAAASLQAAERGSAPILLLDEIAAHLDRERRSALFDAVLALGVQAWMTGTEPETFAALGERAQRFAVADGAVAPLA